MNITVPGSLDAEPKYVGPADQARRTLFPGIYVTTDPGRALVVTEDASFLIVVANDTETDAEPYERTPVAALEGYAKQAQGTKNRRIGLVDNRAAIVDGREFRAMSTIETIERLATRAIVALDDENMGEGDQVDHVHVLLTAIADLAGARTATEVGSIADSDALSADATDAVKAVIADFDDKNRAIAESYSRVNIRYER